MLGANIHIFTKFIDRLEGLHKYPSYTPCYLCDGVVRIDSICLNHPELVHNQLLQPYNQFAELVLTSYTWTAVTGYSLVVTGYKRALLLITIPCLDLKHSSQPVLQEKSVYPNSSPALIWRIGPEIGRMCCQSQSLSLWCKASYIWHFNTFDWWISYSLYYFPTFLAS